MTVGVREDTRGWDEKGAGEGLGGGQVRLAASMRGWGRVQPPGVRGKAVWKDGIARVGCAPAPVRWPGRSMDCGWVKPVWS